MLLPGKYSEERTHEGEYEVRGNLKTFVPEEENTDKWVMDWWMSVIISLRYCVVFRVDKAMKACARNEETRALQRGLYLLTSSSPSLVPPQALMSACPASPKRAGLTWVTGARVTGFSPR